MTVLERWQDEVLALFRIVVGFLFACHGLAALFGVLGDKEVEAFARVAALISSPRMSFRRPCCGRGDGRRS